MIWHIDLQHPPDIGFFLTNMVVTDQVPDNYVDVRVDPSGTNQEWTCRVAGNLVQCSHVGGTLRVSGQVSFFTRITLQAVAAKPGTVTNVVSLEATQVQYLASGLLVDLRMPVIVTARSTQVIVGAVGAAMPSAPSAPTATLIPDLFPPALPGQPPSMPSPPSPEGAGQEPGAVSPVVPASRAAAALTAAGAAVVVGAGCSQFCGGLCSRPPGGFVYFGAHALTMLNALGALVSRLTGFAGLF